MDPAALPQSSVYSLAGHVEGPTAAQVGGYLDLFLGEEDPHCTTFRRRDHLPMVVTIRSTRIVEILRLRD